MISGLIWRHWCTLECCCSSRDKTNLRKPSGLLWGGWHALFVKPWKQPPVCFEATKSARNAKQDHYYGLHFDRIKIWSIVSKSMLLFHNLAWNRLQPLSCLSSGPLLGPPCTPQDNELDKQNVKKLRLDVFFCFFIQSKESQAIQPDADLHRVAYKHSHYGG